MLTTIRNAWKIPELRRKLLFTLVIILLYRIGNVIPVPGVNVQQMSLMFSQQLSNTIFGLFDMMSGSAFSQATIFALSIQPYINASIIIQLLTIAIPALERLSKEGGEEGKKKLTLQSAAKKYHLSQSMLSEYHSLSKLDEKIKDEQRKSGQIPLRELKKLAVEKLRKDPEEMWRKYGELKKKYPTEEERVQLDGQKGPAKQKDPNAPNKIRAKHIAGMKTRPESDFEYYSRLTLDEFEKYTADELKAAKANLQAAQIRYQDLIQLLSTLQQNIEEVEQKQQAEEK